MSLNRKIFEPLQPKDPQTLINVIPPVFEGLADSAYVREAQLVQGNSRPASTAPLPFSSPTLWRKVKAGTFPKPVKLSARVTAWKVGNVRAWLLAQEAA